MARAKAPKNTGSQGFTHTSTPQGQDVKGPSTPMAMPGQGASKPAQPACTEMRGPADAMTGTSGGGMMEPK